MAKILILANEDLKNKYIQKATDWIENPNQKMFSNSNDVAVAAVAEFIANERGLTLYSTNAKYK